MSAEELVVSVLAEHRKIGMGCTCEAWSGDALSELNFTEQHSLHVAFFVVAALGIEQVGWQMCASSALPGSLRTTADGHWAKCPDCVPVYRLKALEG